MQFGRFRIDRERLVLEHRGTPVALAPKSVELLAVLAERTGDVVTKRELLDRLWPDSAVEEANLSQHVYLIRKTLGACEAAASAAIVTVPKRGYRFVVPGQVGVRLRAPSEAGGASRAPAEIDRESRTVPAADLGRTSSPLAGHAGLPEAAMRPESATVRTKSPVARLWSGWRSWPAAAAIAALAVLLAAAAAVPRHAVPSLSAEGSEAARLGRYYLDLRTAAGIARSRTYFERVIAGDPHNPTGYAGLADALTMTADYRVGPLPRMTYLDRARGLAQRAAALDPESAAPHASLGIIAQYVHDERTAQRELRRAIALDANYAPAHHWLGTALFDDGDFSGSLRELEIAAQLNPMSTASNVWLAMAAYFEHRYDVAIEHGRRALELDPGRTDLLREIGLAYAAKGDYRDALATFGRIPHDAVDASLVPFLKAGIYAEAGQPDIARRIVERERRRHISNPELPFTLLALGETHAAANAAAGVRPRDCRERREFVGDPRFDAVRGSSDFGSVFAGQCSDPG